MFLFFFRLVDYKNSFRSLDTIGKSDVTKGTKKDKAVFCTTTGRDTSLHQPS